MNEFSDFAEVVGIESEMTAVIDKAVDECKAYFLLGGADAYMKFATVENLVPDEE